MSPPLLPLDTACSASNPTNQPLLGNVHSPRHQISAQSTYALASPPAGSHRDNLSQRRSSSRQQTSQLAMALTWFLRNKASYFRHLFTYTGIFSLFVSMYMTLLAACLMGIGRQTSDPDHRLAVFDNGSNATNSANMPPGSVVGATFIRAGIGSGDSLESYLNYTKTSDAQHLYETIYYLPRGLLCMVPFFLVYQIRTIYESKSKGAAAIIFVGEALSNILSFTEAIETVRTGEVRSGEGGGGAQGAKQRCCMSGCLALLVAVTPRQPLGSLLRSSLTPFARPSPVLASIF